MTGLENLATAIIIRLAFAGLQGLVLGAAVMLALRALPGLAPRWRCRLWWLVALQLVVGVCSPWGLELKTDWVSDRSPLFTHDEVSMSTIELPMYARSGIESDAGIEAPRRFETLMLGAAGLWCALLLAQAAMGLRHGVRLRRRVGQARPLTDPWILAELQTLAGELGIRRLPGLRSCPRSEGPQLVGLLRPTILLPASACTRSEMRLSLAHELLHLRRGDLWWSWIPALAQSIHVFNPIAHLVTREYALAREAAVDAEVIRMCRVDPADYATLLVRFGVKAGPSLSVAAASPTFRHYQRRLQMLAKPANSSVTQRLTGIACALLVAAGCTPVVSVSNAETAEPEVAEHQSLMFSDGHDTRVMWGAAMQVDDQGTLVSLTDHDGERYEVPAQGAAAGLWFPRDGSLYLIDDPETLAEVRALLLPAQALADQQRKLGEQQARFGAEQSRLGAQQQALGEQLSALAEEIQIQVRSAKPDETRLDEIGREMEVLSDRMDALGDEQAQWADQQEALGDQQGELGERQEARWAEAESRVEALLDQALESGKARSVTTL